MKDAQALAPRLASLAAAHRALESEIRDELRRAAPDFAHVAGLKRRKLAIKDSLAALSRRAGSDAPGLTA
jgi:hypothetical protein